jgi:hypothetical protein
MNRFSIINTLQKQVKDLQEQVSFLEFYLKEAMASTDSGQMVPAPNEGGSNPFYGDPSYPYGNDGIIPYAPHPYYWTPGDYNNPLNPTPFQYPQKPSWGPDHPARYNGRPYYRIAQAGQQAGSQSGTFSPGGFHQTAKKRGMQGFPPSYSPGSQSSQQPPPTKPPPVATGRRRRS